MPYTNQSLYEALVKDHEPIGTYAIEYLIYDDDIGDEMTHMMIDHVYFSLNQSLPGILIDIFNKNIFLYFIWM